MGTSPSAFCAAVLGAVLKSEAFEWTKAIAKEYCNVAIGAADPLASPLVALIFLFYSGVLQASLVSLAKEFDFVAPGTVPSGLYAFAIIAIQRTVQGLHLKGPKFDLKSLVVDVNAILTHRDNEDLLKRLSDQFTIHHRGSGDYVLGSNGDDSDSDNNAHRH
jgi:hypothetical protein